MQYLYQHVTEISTFEKVVVGNKDLHKHEKVYLIKIARSTVHTKTISFCLEKLSQTDKKEIFLDHIKQKKHSKKAHKIMLKHVPNYSKELEELILKVESELVEMLID